MSLGRIQRQSLKGWRRIDSQMYSNPMINFSHTPRTDAPLLPTHDSPRLHPVPLDRPPAQFPSEVCQFWIRHSILIGLAYGLSFWWLIGCNASFIFFFFFNGSSLLWPQHTLLDIYYQVLMMFQVELNCLFNGSLCWSIAGSGRNASYTLVASLLLQSIAKAVLAWTHPFASALCIVIVACSSSCDCYRPQGTGRGLPAKH
jgi:hypothetical protein